MMPTPVFRRPGEQNQPCAEPFPNAEEQGDGVSSVVLEVKKEIPAYILPLVWLELLRLLYEVPNEKQAAPVARLGGWFSSRMRLCIRTSRKRRVREQAV